MRASLTGVLLLAVAAGCGGGDKNNPDSPDNGDGGATDAPRNLPDAAVATCVPVNGTNIVMVPVATGLDQPLMIAQPPGDTRLFVIEQSGKIKVIKDGQVLATPFLDLSGANGPVLSGGERGLLGIAFHPDFRNNDRFYVHFSAKPNGDHTFAEFRANFGTDTADPNSRRDILKFADPYSNHNSGMIEFGNDGMLYLSLGDGGSGGDPENRSQDDRSLFGKMLRIDVDSRTGTKEYGIPSDNPFANSADGAGDPRPEIWDKGFRNPFRWSFDRMTGDLYVGDVGQGPNPPNLEEIDIVHNTPGLNFGWRIEEANRCFNPATNCNLNGITQPMVVRGGAQGWTSIMGGQVYRGSCFPDLQGTYFYGEYATGQLWSLKWDGGTNSISNDHQAVTGSQGNITAIHADALGEIYVVTHNGNIRRITATP